MNFLTKAETIQQMTSSLSIVVLVAMLAAGCNSQFTTCKNHLKANPGSPSGVYQMITTSEVAVEVYCEMGLDNGGYTFLSPFALSHMTNEELSDMITDRTTVLLRVRKIHGMQTYATLSQLPEYSSIPLKLGLSNFDGYKGPYERTFLGEPFLFLGFLPEEKASKKSVQGLLVNGQRNAFKNCNGNPNSLIALFPNFNELPPSKKHQPVAGVCKNIFKYLKKNPSRRVMPVEYFMFGEMSFGGCGCSRQSTSFPEVRGMAIGFK